MGIPSRSQLCLPQKTQATSASPSAPSVPTRRLATRCESSTQRLVCPLYLGRDPRGSIFCLEHAFVQFFAHVVWHHASAAGSSPIESGVPSFVWVPIEALAHFRSRL